MRRDCVEGSLSEDNSDDSIDPSTFAVKRTKAESAWDIPYLNRKIFLFCHQIFESCFFVINFSYFVSDF